MAQKKGESRSGGRSANRQPVVDDDDDDEEDEAMSDAELMTQVNSAAGRNGGRVDAVALDYLRNLRRVRKVKNRWKKAYEELQQEMPEGSLVLVGEEADAVRGLIEARKLDPKKLTGLIETLESDLAKERKTNLENAEQLASSRVAELTGYNKDAFDTVRRSGTLHVEFRPIEVDEKGQKVKKDYPFVRPKADDKAPLVKFDDYVDQHQKHMWPALKAGSQQNGNRQSSGTATAVVDGTSAPRDGTGGETNPVKAMLERDRKRAEERKVDPFAIARRAPVSTQ